MATPKKGLFGKKRIGELLVEAGYVTATQVRRALDIQKRRNERICAILIDLGYLSEKDFLEFLGTIPGSASIEISACEIEQEIIDLVPRELARSLELVPIGKLGSSLTVAMVCPIDETGRQELQELTGLKVRPVLCARAAVFAALDKYYAEVKEPVPMEESKVEEREEAISELEASMKLKRIAKLVQEIGEIPTLPTILSAISEIINDPNSSASDLAKVISTDVGLSAKILKLANSAAFGFSREISDIQHAIALLGFRQTQALALSVPIFENLIKLADLDFASFWSHSLRCAKLSKLISLTLADRGLESAFVAGLLHDIGRVVIAMNMRGKQEEAVSLRFSSGITPIEAEEKVLGITHAEVGYHLGEHWFLPAVLTGAIRYHHSPELQTEPEDSPGVVFLADYYCDKSADELREMKDFDDRTLEALSGLRISDTAFKKALESFATMPTEADLQVFL